MTPDYTTTARHADSRRPARRTEHFVADVAETPLQVTDRVKDEAAPLSLWGEAWKNLRKQPLFLISAFLILVVVAVSVFPGLFSQIDPTSEACQLANSDAGPAAGHPLGFTQQGCDVYARVIFGTRSSVTVGLFTTIGNAGRCVVPALMAPVVDRQPSKRNVLLSIWVATVLT